MKALLTVEQLSVYIHKSVASIRSDATRNPQSLPPLYRLPGTKRLRWRAEYFVAQQLDPGLDVGDPLAMKVRDLVDRIKTVDWLTLIDDGMLTRVGNIDGLQSELPKVQHGTVRAGPAHPCWLAAASRHASGRWPADRLSVGVCGTQRGAARDPRGQRKESSTRDRQRRHASL